MCSGSYHDNMSIQSAILLIHSNPPERPEDYFPMVYYLGFGLLLSLILMSMARGKAHKRISYLFNFGFAILVLPIVFFVWHIVDLNKFSSDFFMLAPVFMALGAIGLIILGLKKEASLTHKYVYLSVGLVFGTIMTFGLLDFNMLFDLLIVPHGWWALFIPAVSVFALVFERKIDRDSLSILSVPWSGLVVLLVVVIIFSGNQ